MSTISHPSPPPLPISSTPDWSRLPSDILSTIFSLLPSNSLCITFRSVCRSWRSASPPHLPFPLLLYPPPSRLEPDGHNFCNFFDLVDSRYGTLDLPHLRGNLFCGSTHGFLLLRSNGSRPPFLIAAFNPFTDHLIPLPPLLTHAPPEKIILTSLPPSPLAAVAIMGWDLPLYFFSQRGPDSWTPLKEPTSSSSFHDAICCDGGLYAVDASRNVFVFDHPIGPGTVPEKYRISENGEIFRKEEDREDREEKNYLVESFGDLFLVIRSFICSRDMYEHATLVTTKLEVVKLDLFEKEKTWSVVESLGDGVLFLGVNTSFSLSAANLSRSEPFEDNIYFTDDGFNHLGEMVGREEDVGYFYVDRNELTHSMCRADIPGPVIPPAIFFVPSLIDGTHKRGCTLGAGSQAANLGVKGD